MVSALANIIIGFSVFIFQIACTRIIASTGADNLQVLALAISFAGFAPLFAFNLNTVVARLAIKLEPRHSIELPSMLFHAMRLSRRYLGIAIIAILVSSPFLPIVFPSQIGTQPVAQGLGIAGFFIGSCWIVLAQPFQGILIARQQNLLIAKATLLGRFFALLVLWGVIRLTDSLPVALMACGSSLWLSYWLMQRDVPKWRGWKPAHFKGQYGAMLGEIARGFALWSITALLFQASLVPLAGAIDPASMAPVYLAATLFAILVGVVNSGTGALIVPIGRMEGKEAFASVARLSWLVGLLLVIYTAILFLALPRIIELWVGNLVDVAQVQRYLVFIAGLQCVRLSGAVSSVMLMIKAENRQITGPSLFELVGLLGLAVPVGFMAGVPSMLAILIAICCIASCATIVMGSRLNDVPPCDKRLIGMLCLPLGFAAVFVTIGFVLG